MAISLTHSKVSAKLDGADSTLVQPSDWNAEHGLTAGANVVLGTTTAGAVQEISVGSGLTIAGGTLALNGGVYNVRDYNATGDGATDDYAAIQAAVDAAEAAGGGTVFFPPGMYNVNTRVTIDNHGVRLVGAGKGISTIRRVGTGNCVYIAGSATTGQGNTLASNGDPGDTSIALSSGKGANFAADDWGLLIDETVIPDSTSMKQAQFIQVRSVSTDTLNLMSPIADYSFLTSATAQVRPLNLLTNIEVRDLSFCNSAPSSSTDHLLSVFYCNAPVFDNVELYDSARAGITFFFCVNARANVYAHDLLSDSGLLYHGYGIAEAAANMGGNFNIQANRVRHAYTTVDTATYAYGVPTGTVVTGNASDCEQANWDVHPPALRVQFVNVVANGCRHAGIQIRGKQCAVVGARIAGCIGPGIYVTSTANQTDISNVVAERTNQGTDNDGVDWTNSGCLYDRALSTTVRGMRILNCGGPGLEPSTFAEDWDYSHIRIVDPCRITTTVKDAVSALQTTTCNGRLSHIDISCSDTRMDYGVRATSNNLSLAVFDVLVSGAQTSSFSLASGHHQYLNDSSGTFVTPLTVNRGSATTSELIVGGSNAQDALITLNANSARQRYIRGRTAGVDRWHLRMPDSATESGSNAGSNFVLSARDDSGANIGTALSITRSTMAATFGASVSDPIGRLQAIPRSTTTALTDITNAINTTNKFSGKVVINTTTGAIVTANGSTAGSTWLALDGTTAHTPV